MEELKAFLQKQLRNAYDIKEGQVASSARAMREAERFFILQQIDTLWRSTSRRWIPCANRWACAVTARRIP